MMSDFKLTFAIFDWKRNALILQLKHFRSFPLRIGVECGRVWWRTEALGIWAEAYKQQAVEHSDLENTLLPFHSFLLV